MNKVKNFNESLALWSLAVFVEVNSLMPKLFQLSSTHSKARKMLNMCAKDVEKKLAEFAFATTMRSAGKASSMPWCLRTQSTSSSLRKLGSLPSSCNTMTRCSVVDSWATWQFIGPKMKSWNFLQTTSKVALLIAMHQPACFGMLWPSSRLCGPVRLNSRLRKRFKALTLKIPWRNLSWWTIRLGGRFLWWLRRNVIVLRWSPWMDMRRSQQNARDPPSKGGRPRKHGQIRHFNNGWFKRFMVTSPDIGLILLIVEMRNPEDNAIALSSLEKILELYPNVNAVIYDRACSCMSAGQKMSSLQGIKYWAVDRFHARGHFANCPCHPILTSLVSAKGWKASTHPLQNSHLLGFVAMLTHQFYGASNAKVLCSGIWAQAQQHGEMQRLAALESVLYGEEASQGHSLSEEACQQSVPMQSESNEKAAFLSCHETPGIVIYFYGICAQTSCCEILNDIWIAWWQILWRRIAISEWFVFLVP